MTIRDSSLKVIYESFSILVYSNSDPFSSTLMIFFKSLTVHLLVLCSVVYDSFSKRLSVILNRIRVIYHYV